MCLLSLFVPEKYETKEARPGTHTRPVGDAPIPTVPDRNLNRPWSRAFHPKPGDGGGRNTDLFWGVDSGDLVEGSMWVQVTQVLGPCPLDNGRDGVAHTLPAMGSTGQSRVDDGQDHPRSRSRWGPPPTPVWSWKPGPRHGRRKRGREVHPWSRSCRRRSTRRQPRQLQNRCSTVSEVPHDPRLPQTKGPTHRPHWKPTGVVLPTSVLGDGGT